MAGTGKAHLRPGSLLSVEDLVVEHRTRQGTVKAVSGVSFDVQAGETLGVVGESGCGKSSIARALVRLPPPTAGKVELAGDDLGRLGERDLRRVRSRLQLIFQDPVASLNPLRRVEDIVAEGLAIRDGGRHRERAHELLDAVGLDGERDGRRRARQFSGGQCQRICIARALALDPEILVCDEPVSALDVSVQAQILNLIADMKERYELTVVFIAHDLAVVRQVSTRLVVMYLGTFCEVGPPGTIFAAPAHPYTALLMDAIPVPDPTVPISPATITGELPSPMDPPSGCRFRTRCPSADERCDAEQPQLRAVGDGRYVACHHPLVDVAVGSG